MSTELGSNGYARFDKHRLWCLTKSTGAGFVIARSINSRSLEGSRPTSNFHESGNRDPRCGAEYGVPPATDRMHTAPLMRAASGCLESTVSEGGYS